MADESKQTLFGFPVEFVEGGPEGEILFGSFPQPERPDMTIEEYADQCALLGINSELSTRRLGIEVESMSAGLTWAANAADEKTRRLAEFTTLFLKVRDSVRLSHVRISRATLLEFPRLDPDALPSVRPLDHLLGVPIEIDNSLGLYEFVPVYG